MNRVLLIYDIENDRARTKIANACLDYGLDRVQFSAFVGRLSRNHQEELMQRLTKLLGKGKGCISLIPIGVQEWNNRMEVNHA